MANTSLLRIVFAVTAIVLLAAVQTNLTLPRGRAQPTLISAESETPAFQSRSALTSPLPKPGIVVKKARRVLLLYSNDKLVRTYHVGLGLSPLGDKVRAGDRRTPEGDFYIFTKNNKSAFYLSLGVSYPNTPHAERGLRDGLISRSQYQSIISAVKSKRTPPQNTRLGGDIYIHGNGAQSDWTWGCVALENQDISELFDAVTVGTPVTIQP
ncbi:MAG: L,D-transpeptidase family protein [Acidobacteriota bacterium]